MEHEERGDKDGKWVEGVRKNCHVLLRKRLKYGFPPGDDGKHTPPQTQNAFL